MTVPDERHLGAPAARRPAAGVPIILALLLGVLAACNSNGGSSGSPFRNLGKRGDSNLGAVKGAPARQ